MASTRGAERTLADVLRLSTSHEELIALDASLAFALARRDVTRARELTAAVFPRPFALPPLLDTDIAQFAEKLATAPDQEGWWGWLVIDSMRTIVGFVLCTPPDADGVSMIGWSTYPEHRGKGHARRAAQTLVEWAFRFASVRVIRATIPPALDASRHLATRLGMTLVGTDMNDEVGEVHVFELTR
jgi:RimJ/RimL family protein N-acetyltransferase